MVTGLSRGGIGIPKPDRQCAETFPEARPNVEPLPLLESSPVNSALGNAPAVRQNLNYKGIAFGPQREPGVFQINNGAALLICQHFRKPSAVDGFLAWIDGSNPADFSVFPSGLPMPAGDIIALIDLAFGFHIGQGIVTGRAQDHDFIPRRVWIVHLVNSHAGICQKVM